MTSGNNDNDPLGDVTDSAVVMMNAGREAAARTSSSDFHDSGMHSDPTDFEGQVPVWSGYSDHDRELRRQKTKNNAVQGASAAGARALTTQVVAFYFRYPVKAFMRLRVDYMQVARAINPYVQAQEAWSFRQSTVGVLAHAVKAKGWSFIPYQVLPPLVANVGVSAILYTSYLQILQQLHEPANQSMKRVYPPPPVWATFAAGATAGAIQSVIAAPLDAISVRFDTNELLEGEFKSIWAYSAHKLREIGFRGVFAGYGLSLFKETMSYGLFFSSFELIKQQCYYSFLIHFYGNRKNFYFLSPDQNFSKDKKDPLITISPHWTIEPLFLLMAGATASVTSQLVLHPMSLIQSVHYNRLESIDLQKKLAEKSPHLAPSSTTKPPAVGLHWFTAYKKEYAKTYELLRYQASKNEMGWRRYLYRGFLWNTIRSTPSTAAALIIFELMRRRFGEEGEGVRISHGGFEIAL